jgi:hypothetical protein
MVIITIIHPTKRNPNKRGRSRNILSFLDNHIRLFIEDKLQIIPIINTIHFITKNF